MSSPASLRDLYHDPPPSTWSFLPAPPSTPPNAATPNSTTPSPSTHTYQWSTRPTHNSIFDLSPSLDLSEPSSVDARLLVKSLVASAVLQYTSTAIAMPWEVGKMLLQVQWVPRDAVASEPATGPDEYEEEEVLSESSNENDSYFADPNSPLSRYPVSRPADDQGYIIRRSVHEDGTRPEYIIPVGSANGVWGMIKQIAGFRGEGWLALWKGLLTSCVYDMLSANLQPFIQNLLQSIFLPTISPFHQPPILLPVASHLFTGFLLSPLDLIRTRLIVQSSLPRHRTYTGPINALSQILQHEGGLKGIYFHPHLFIPCFIDNSLRPLVSLALPGILASFLGSHITEETHPISWRLAELVGSCAGLLVTLPFETVRRRLQVQVRGTAKPVKACVELRPVPYHGIVDTMWHVLTEERSDLPLIRRKKHTVRKDTKGKGREVEERQVELVEDGGSESWLRHTGVGQLFRGLGMRVGASVIVFLLAMLSGGEEKDAGWAEL